jgi:hypothetical protein
MKIIQTIFFITALASCKQSFKQKNLINNETNRNGLSTSIIITNDDYILHLNHINDTFTTITKLSNAIEKFKDQIEEDSVYIHMLSTKADRMGNISSMLRGLKINNYKFIITEEYFTLPYPNDEKKVDHQ